jgi:hypothetical protein
MKVKRKLSNADLAEAMVEPRRGETQWEEPFEVNLSTHTVIKLRSITGKTTHRQLTEEIEKIIRQYANQAVQNDFDERLVKMEAEDALYSLREATFGCSDEEAKPIIDEHLEEHPELLDLHDVEWYYKYC